MKDKITNVVVGVLFIIAGIVFGGNAIDLWNINIFFPG